MPFSLNMHDMRKLMLMAGLFLSAAVFAQDATVQELKATGTKALVEDTTHKSGWKKGVLLNLGIAQGSSSNWAAGAEQNSFSINSYVSLFANLKQGKERWFTNLDLFYALMNNTSQGTRKNDDRIDLFSKYTHKFSNTWGFGGVFNFRTQFSDGYDYNVTPKELISGFMAPGYMTVAPGIDWMPAEYFSVFLSPFSGRWTFVTKPELTARYAVDPGKTVRTEAGGYLTANFKKEILKNVIYSARLDLYSNYLDGKAKNVDVFWTNVITMKVNKFLGVTYNFDLIYDDDIRSFGDNGTSPATQIKSLLSVGITTRF